MPRPLHPVPIAVWAAALLLPAAPVRAQLRAEDVRAAERKLVALTGPMREETKRDRRSALAAVQSAGTVTAATSSALKRTYDRHKGRAMRIFAASNVERLDRILRPKLLAARAAARRRIGDEQAYPHEGPPEAQQAVDREIARVRVLWIDPASVLVAEHAESGRAVAVLREMEFIMKTLGLIDARAGADLSGAFDAANVALRRRWMMAGDLATLGYNRTLLVCLSPEERRLVSAVNDHRLMLGLRALEIDPRLIAAARGHSAEMVRLKYFDHESPTDGRTTPADRARREHFPGPVAENIASGRRTGADTLRSWIASARHHRSLIHPDHTLVGVGHAPGGRYRHNWTSMFGQGRGFQGRPPPALITYFKRSLALNSSLPDEYFRLALYCRRHGFTARMRYELARVIARNPDHKQARALLGHVLSLEGRWVPRDPDETESPGPRKP